MPKLFFKVFFLALTMSKKAEKSLPYHVVYFLEACKIFKWLHGHDSKHLHAHFGTNSAEIVMLASELTGIPYSFTVHGPEEFDKPQALHLNKKIKYAKFVAAISSFGRSQLYRWADYKDWEKIKVVHCGLEPAFYDVPASVMPIKNSMVCVGRICEQKGQLLLIEAVKKLHDAGVDFNLTLAGDGEMRTEVESLIVKYGFSKKISITGWISSEKVRQLILNAQVMVLPSFAEGLPVVIMEAMSLRRPVISTYIAGIPELIKNGENGWLCEAGNIDALADTIQQALETPKKQTQMMCDLAYKRAVARHCIDTEASKLAEYIRG
jgi:glycosyltransferase involved in cell wall biosynthesis